MKPAFWALVVLLCSTRPTPAWWVKGHAVLAEGAVSGLPEDMPAFFRAAGKQLGHLAGDPDRFKNPDAKHLRAAEGPDHYIDLEDLQGHELPADRYRAAALLVQLKQRPERTGLLPYSLMEASDRLAVAFYDYRQVVKQEKKSLAHGEQATEAEKKALAAEKQAIEMKCVVYAGILAHYAGDAAMPLHTTVDFDGRTKEKGPDGKKRQAGIHAKIDAFPETNGFTAEEVGRDLQAREIEDLWKRVLGTIQESYKHIDRCYGLDAAGALDKPTPESRKFILERCRFGAQLTMDLWYTAWKRSAKLPPHF